MSTLFNETIRQLIDIYNNINYEGNALNYNEATEEQITESILELDNIKVTYDNLKVTKYGRKYAELNHSKVH